MEVYICCYFCCQENLLSIYKMKEEFKCGGQKPLQLCQARADLGIKPPTTNAATSFVEKSKHDKVTKIKKSNMRVGIQ